LSISELVKDFNIKIFADGADEETMYSMNNSDFIDGLTTNPTLMKQSGITDYVKFCKTILGKIKTKPISFEVFADDFDEMERQAQEIAGWGENIYVKIPVTNTKGETCYELIRKLSHQGIKVNITAVMTEKQVSEIIEHLSKMTPSYISVFAGRIADTGRDPELIMKRSLEIIKKNSCCELIWASPRELLNIIQANNMGCHIITVTEGILKKLSLLGYGLDSFSLDTVKMFYEDAKKAGYKI
jgi:transaldolase